MAPSRIDDRASFLIPEAVYQKQKRDLHDEPKALFSVKSFSMIHLRLAERRLAACNRPAQSVHNSVRFVLPEQLTLLITISERAISLARTRRIPELDRAGESFAKSTINQDNRDCRMQREASRKKASSF